MSRDVIIGGSTIWETRHSMRGNPYQVIGRERMPRIPDVIQDCAVYLYPDERSAKAGESIGGSALLMMHQENDDSYHQIYVVTNSHVVEEGNCAIRINTRSGLHDVIQTNETEWHLHPNGDDLAVCPVKLDIAIFKYALLTPMMFATRSLVQRFNIGMGDDCFVVGRFINHEGKQRNQPSVRFGNIAQMPGDPLMRELKNGKFTPQESYLVEAKSISGYSGSPVFVYLAPSIAERKVSLPLPGEWRGPWLLGINWCYLSGPSSPVFQRDDRTGNLHKTNYCAQTNSGMMGVIPAWKLEELMNDERVTALRQARYEEERRERQRNPAPTQTTSAKSEPPATDENPEHKEDFRHLVRAASTTPKSDEKT
jgi:hypothetical protein